MRNIQVCLERWGAWVAANRETVYWPPIAAGFNGLIPTKIKCRDQCCDEDGLIISKVMAEIRASYPVAHDLIFDYYVFGKTFMQLSKEHHCSDGHIGKKLEGAEGLFKGYLLALHIVLEMDRYINLEKVS